MQQIDPTEVQVIPLVFRKYGIADTVIHARGNKREGGMNEANHKCYGAKEDEEQEKTAQSKYEV